LSVDGFLLSQALLILTCSRTQDARQIGGCKAGETFALLRNLGKRQLGTIISADELTVDADML